MNKLIKMTVLMAALSVNYVMAINSIRPQIKIAFNSDIAGYTNADSLMVEAYKELGFDVDTAIVPNNRQQAMWEANLVDAFGLRMISDKIDGYEKIEELNIPLDVKLWGKIEKPIVKNINEKM